MAPKNKTKTAKATKPAPAPRARGNASAQRVVSVMPLVFMVLAVVLACAAGAVYWLVLRPQLAAREAAQTMPPIGAPFSLINDQGQPVTEKNLANGHDYHLVFFGYTSCPDECPTMLNTVAQAMQKISPAQQDRIKMVLVSVDPRRDTPARLREYLDGFDHRFVGWTGPKAEIDRMTQGYMAFYSIKEPEHDDMAGMEHDHGDDEEISHSSVLYLMGPDGKYVTHMSQEDGADGIAARIAEFVK